MADANSANQQSTTDGAELRPPAWRGHVAPAQAGDRASRASLYRTFAPTVHAIALAHVGAQHADDLTQDVFCTVFASLASLREPAALPGFVCTTARNAARDVLRRRKRVPPTQPTDGLSARGPTPVDAAADRELAGRVLAAIQTLPEAYRETLLLRLVSGLGGVEIAERTGMTHGSVRVNLTRGMGLLRERLGGLLSEEKP